MLHLNLARTRLGKNAFHSVAITYTFVSGLKGEKNSLDNIYIKTMTNQITKLFKKLSY